MADHNKDVKILMSEVLTSKNTEEPDLDDLVKDFDDNTLSNIRSMNVKPLGRTHMNNEDTETVLIN